MNSSTRRRPGRPAGHPQRIRPNRIVSFVTDRELERIQELAAVSGQSQSATVHALMSFALSHKRFLLRGNGAPRKTREEAEQENPRS